MIIILLSLLANIRSDFTTLTLLDEKSHLLSLKFPVLKFNNRNQYNDQVIFLEKRLCFPNNISDLNNCDNTVF